MAQNKIRIVALALAALVLFLAGGWFFTSLPKWRAPKGEVEELYSEDGEALGIFDNIPPEDLAAAETAALYGLNQEIVLPENTVQATLQDGADLPSQIALTDMADIAGVAPIERPDPLEEEDNAVPLGLTGQEENVLLNQDISSLPEGESKITLVSAPVQYFLIEDAQQYKDFKTRARGRYPEMNFKKQMLVGLESQSNLPDNVFEIISAEVKDGKLYITYRVNVFDLQDKINTHTVIAVDNTALPIELKQIR